MKEKEFMKAISQRLKDKVDSHCDYFRSNCKLFKEGHRPDVNFFQVATYVVSLELLFYTNCQDILAASKRYEESPELSEFFINKFNEEKGHDAWARADWVKMSKKQNFKTEPQVLESMKDLLSFLNTTMKSSPYRYVTYIYAAEYFTTILGPVWLDIMRSNLGIQKKEISALSNHIELDGDHAQEVAEVIESFQLSQEVHDDMVVFIDELFAKYFNFFTEVAETNEHKYINNQKDSRSVLAIA